MTANPFEVLGVPKILVAHARDEHNLSRVLRLTEGMYRTYVREFHPDRPGGDADIMASFTEAWATLQSHDLFRYYVDGYIDSKTAARARQETAERQQDQRNRAALTALAQAFAVSPSERLGLSGASSVLVRGAASYTDTTFDVVIEVDTEVRIFRSSRPSVLTFPEKNRAWRKGYWSEAQVPVTGRLRRFTHNTLVQIPGSTVLGGVHVEYGSYVPSIFEMHGNNHTLESASLQREVEWVKTEHAWWLPDLTSSVDKDDQVAIIGRDGRVALLGYIVDKALLQ